MTTRTVFIPPIVLGIPDWLSALQPGETSESNRLRLDDECWCNATKRAYGGGAEEASFRAIFANVGGQNFLYLSFAVKFAAGISTAKDSVFLGLQTLSGTDMMLIRLDIHDPNNTSVGYPSSTLPAYAAAIKVWTRNSPTGSWQKQSELVSDPNMPDWINSGARVWLQKPGDPNGDGNYRWALQMRMPVSATGNLYEEGGPNLGTDFYLWYFIRGGWDTLNQAVVVYGEYRGDGGLTEDWSLENPLESDNNIPAPNTCEEARLGSPTPTTGGGVAIYGNGYSDIAVKDEFDLPTDVGGNIIVEGWNKFIARPRNYTNAPIPAGDINATFRIGNWGSQAGDTWVPIAPNQPVISVEDIPVKQPGQNPDYTTEPIQLVVDPMHRGDRNKHQCILVTLDSNVPMNFLNDSAYRNMDFALGSLLEREAEISLVGLPVVSDKTRRVYLAIEKINMPAKAGTDEGHFLQDSMQRVMHRGGPLAEKLMTVQKQLSAGGDYGSGARLERLIGLWNRTLRETKYADPQTGKMALDQLLGNLASWLRVVKPDEGAARELSGVYGGLAKWLSSAGIESAGKPADEFVTLLDGWLSILGKDPNSEKYLPLVAKSLSTWLSAMPDGSKVAEAVGGVGSWLDTGHPVEQQSGVLSALRENLVMPSMESVAEFLAVGMLSEATSRWLRGYERLDTFVKELSAAGLMQYEIDQLFPTFRVHVYHDTGQRVIGTDGQKHPVVRAQGSFGVYPYHEGGLEGWQTSIPEARRIADNLYYVQVPNNSAANVTIKIQAVAPGETPLAEDPILPEEPIDPNPCGCLCQLLKNMRGTSRNPASG